MIITSLDFVIRRYCIRPARLKKESFRDTDRIPIENWFAQIRTVTRSSLEREVWSSNLGPVKSDIVLPTVRHRCNISSKEAVLPGRNDAEMGPANSLHASAYYGEYNEIFDQLKTLRTEISFYSALLLVNCM